MAKAPRHLGKRSAGAVLALHERFNGEVVDEEKWFKYTGRNRAGRGKEGGHHLDGARSKAVLRPHTKRVGSCQNRAQEKGSE
jgi:hypothetical protein